MKRVLTAAILVAAFLVPLPADAGDLVRLVRNKISAGDLVSSLAAAEDYRIATAEDAEYLDALAWIARGAVMLDRPELAKQMVKKVRAAVRGEAPETLISLGAVIEVEGKLQLRESGRGAAIRYLESELARAKDTAFRSRIRKNINMLSLEGQTAPPVGTSLEALRGKPLVLFFFAEWCGDCKAQAASLTRVWKKYESAGVKMLAVTRLYGGSKDKPMSETEERAQVAKVWAESYPGLANVPVVIDTDAMVAYGASATPTFAIVDRKGIVQFYSATRHTEADLAAQLDSVLGR